MSEDGYDFVHCGLQVRHDIFARKPNSLDAKVFEFVVDRCVALTLLQATMMSAVTKHCDTRFFKEKISFCQQPLHT